MTRRRSRNWSSRRGAKPEIRPPIWEDPNIRLVYREGPIVGEGAVFAAKAALAAREQGKSEEFHGAMMGGEGRAKEASVMRVAEAVGPGLDRLRLDIDPRDVAVHIETSMRLTQALGGSGGPFFFTGEALVPGFVETDQLKEMVEATRTSRVTEGPAPTEAGAGE